MATISIDDAQISELLSKSKTRGLYGVELKNFLESGEKGVQVDLSEGIFKDKKAGSVKTGFESAKRHKDAPEGADNVRVVVSNDNVYLLRQ